MFAKPRPKKSPLPPAPSKKRKAAHAIEEINFDDGARAEYLTGFHKRKVQRQKHAQEEAAKKARQERIDLRKQIREERKQAVENHVKNVEAMLKEAQVAGLGGSGDEAEEDGTGSEKGEQQQQEDDDDEWGGIVEDPAPAPAPALEPVDHEEEYIDEDLYTTVRIEAVSVDRDGLHNKAELEAEDQGGDDGEGRRGDQAGAKASGDKKGRNELPKKKKKKFRYESKLDRQITNRKNKARKAR